ncbi:MAG: hypothetical protein M1813_005154 [Trichoglossum hirsutum]|nr:MAG: hypothetical protein M1813_005154 [Trichoglossum hirsutum]
MSDRDLEFGERPVDKRTSWATKLSPPSVGFRRSRTTGSMTTISPTQTLDARELVTLTDSELHCRDSLILLIVGDQLVKGSLATSCTWYAEFLELKFRHHWHLLRSALKGLNDESIQPQTRDLVVVYDFVIAVAQLLKTKKDLALVEIVDELDNRDFLKQQLDDERAIPNQIVFATLGWLSMLYEAVPHPKADKLEVTKTSTSSSGYRNPLVTRKYCTFKQGFDYIDLPLYSLLGRYGELIPEARTHLVHEAGFSRSHSVECIMVQSVCFYTLQHLAELKIEWVTSLALHLELDSGKKTLKLFQFPSFCRMMYVERKSNILSRLLNDHAARGCEDVRIPDVPTEEFFQEMLLSYRLIFGQDERSYKAFSRMVPVWEEQRGRAHRENMWDCDPMLHTLCGKSSATDDARRIYDEIDASEPTSYYDPNTEFPFFGKRLLELQLFIKQHQPQNLRSLLHDRRNVSAWYTVWSSQVLIFFASFTILLMILSIFLQGWQVLLARQQLKQSYVP